MRYILKRRGNPTKASPSPGDLPGVTVVDKASEDVMLVDADPETLDRHREALADWTAEPEVTYGLPGLKPERPR